MKKAAWLVLAVLMIAAAAGLFYAWPFLAYPTSELDIRMPAPLPSVAADHITAGVAQRDITPPPGLPKFGYSAFARNSDGFHTRLKARAFYLRAPGGTPLAIVQLDLGAGSLPLHHRVAELIAADTDVPAHALSLLVTHTHSGPGNYLGSDFYNVFGANLPGFDPDLFEFLATRIAAAVREAYHNSRPARIAIGQREAWGLTRNRSVAAWARNFNIPEGDIGPSLALRAVNPDLTMLRIDLQADNGCFYPAGALSTFSIHGTAIPASSGPWHADVWHWLSAELEREVHNGLGRPRQKRCDGDNPFPFIHGAAQATHADNNPNFVNAHRGHREARRIGEGLGDAAIALFTSLTSELTEQARAAVASRELDLLHLPREARFGLCERPVVGAAVGGAANDDEVFPVSFLPGLQENWPRRFFTDGCQGVKQWMASRLQLLLPAERFPHRALFQIVRIGELVLVTLPWEVTLEAGNRIRQGVLKELGPGEWKIEISSLANGYFGYAVTPEEYALQYYEGGHTLYGPATLEFLRHTTARLTADLQARGDVDDVPEQSSFTLISRRFWPADAGDRDPAPVEQQAPVFEPATADHEAYWRWRYRDTAPGQLNLARPLISVEEVDAAGGHRLLADDQGAQIQFLVLEHGTDGGLYEVRWYPERWPLTHLPSRFRLAGEAPVTTLYSSTFR